MDDFDLGPPRELPPAVRRVALPCARSDPIADGRHDEWTAAYIKYRVELECYAALRTGNIAMVQDVVANVFADLFTSGRTRVVRTTPKRYLYGAVRYELRRLELIARREDRAGVDIKNGDPGVSAWVPRDAPTDERVLVAEFEHNLQRAIAALPLQRRLVHRLRHQDGLTEEAVAAMLGLSLQKVHAHLRAIRRVVKAALPDRL